jgi:hypothetical protein
MTPVSPTVINADTWIDQELASLRQSIELPGEIASTAPGAAPLRRRWPRGRAGTVRRVRVRGRAVVLRIRHALHARRFDILVFVAAALTSLALGVLIPLLLQ